MTNQDREQLLANLNAGRDELLASVKGMTEEQAAAVPPAGGWSALECAEHVAAGEKLMLRLARKPSVELERQMSREREAGLYARAAARIRKAAAPEMVLPKGRYTTLAEAVAAFLEARQHTLRWLQSYEGDLRRRPVEHPLAGPVSAYELVLIMAAHPARHARQILEGRAR